MTINTGRGSIDFTNIQTITIKMPETQLDGDKKYFFVVLNPTQFISGEGNLQTIYVFKASESLEITKNSTNTLYYYCGVFQTHDDPEFIIGYYPAPLIPLFNATKDNGLYHIVLLPTKSEMEYYFHNPSIEDFKVNDTSYQTQKEFKISVSNTSYCIIKFKPIGYRSNFSIYNMKIDGNITDIAYQNGAFAYIKPPDKNRIFTATINGTDPAKSPVTDIDLKPGINDLYFYKGVKENYTLTIPANSVFTIAKTNETKGVEAKFSYKNPKDGHESDTGFSESNLAVFANEEAKVTITSSICPIVRVILFNIESLPYFEKLTIVYNNQRINKFLQGLLSRYHAIFFANSPGDQFYHLFDEKARELSRIYSADGSVYSFDVHSNQPFIVHINNSEVSVQDYSIYYITWVPDFAYKTMVGISDIVVSGNYQKRAPGFLQAAIIGIAISAFILIAIVAVIIWCCLSKKKKGSNSGSGENV